MGNIRPAVDILNATRSVAASCYNLDSNSNLLNNKGLKATYTFAKTMTETINILIICVQVNQRWMDGWMDGARFNVPQ